MGKNGFNKPWGQHLILDLSGCPEKVLSDKSNILLWNDELVSSIEMVAFGPPIVEHFATHSWNASGYSLLQMIETSNIAAHFAENIGQAYVDIFSCKVFDENIAIQVCEKYFKPQKLVVSNIDRGIFNENTIKSGHIAKNSF